MALDLVIEAPKDPSRTFARLKTGGTGAIVFIIFCGLPGTGKTTLARELARRLGAVYLRIDTRSRKTICAWGGAWWSIPSTHRA
jgi:SpoVK/Ycf46/Vps4 family AAA+-type ATPase